MNNPWDQITTPLTDVNARRIDHTHKLDFFWAKDHLGHFLFIYEFPASNNITKSNLPDIKGMQIFSIISADDPNINRLIILLKEQSNWEIFLSLCQDLMQATRSTQDSPAAIQIILRRLKRWQEFLKKERPDILTEEEIKGLIGELLFLKWYLIPVFGCDQSVKFWQGPEGSPQDFNVGESVIEVKCQSGSSPPVVKISSINQLCPVFPEMYLMIFTLGKIPPEDKNAINLPSLVSDIRTSLEAISANSIERFNDLLYMIGYTDSDRYLEYSYIVVNQKMFKVRDGFPRICSNQIPDGIVQLSYSINLTACASFEEYPAWMEVNNGHK
jgi:hypothetical protein